MEDLISRQAAIDASCKDWCGCTYANCPNQFDLESERFCDGCDTVVILKKLPSAQPEYEELTPEEAASEIASGSTMSAWYWIDDMTRLKQMGYAICRKKG